MAESIELQVNDVRSLPDLSADDLMLSGCCMEAVSGTIGEYPAKNITFTNNSVIVEAEPFLIDKSNGENGEAFALNCTNDTLSFTYDAITKISCPEYDAFTDEEITVGGTTLNYKLYTPASSTETPLPIVIYNHGGEHSPDTTAFLAIPLPAHGPQLPHSPKCPAMFWLRIVLQYPANQ